jgi:cytochrome c oxidase cbb3-type subunit 3
MRTEHEIPGDPHTAVWHEVDGIVEHDNKLPNWWLFTLFAAMFFAVVYWLAYQTTGALPSLRETYREDYAEHVAKQAAAAAARPLNDETLIALSKDEAAVARGKVTFTAICAACHAANGEGLVGPNLTDNAWIHGAKPMAMHLVVAEGVIAKGMPSWKATLGDSGTKDVIAFVLTLKGKNLPGKAPEGTPE